MTTPRRVPYPRIRTVFMGTPAFAIPSFEAVSRSEDVIAVVTQPDRPSGRGMVLKPSPIKEAAGLKGLPVYQSERIRNDSALIKTLSDLAPDVVVVVAFGQILPETILRIPPLGCVNLHASLLPKFRGAAPIQWAVIQGEKKTGVTTMMMDKGMDTGPILLQQSVEIGPLETADVLSSRLASIGAALLVETLARLKSRSLDPLPQGGEATLIPLLKKEDGYIRWHDSAEAIFNRWRGVFPWPGTATLYDKEPWKIISLEIGARDARWGHPGEILKISGKGLEVAAGIGYIVIERLRLAGGREISPVEYAAGHPFSRALRFYTKEEM